MAASTSVTSMFLPGMNVWQWGVNGKIIGSDASLTTFSLECGSQLPVTTTAIPTPTTTASRCTSFCWTSKNTDYLEPGCSLQSSLHVTADASRVWHNETNVYTLPDTTVNWTTEWNCTWGTNYGQTRTARAGDGTTPTAQLRGQCTTHLLLSGTAKPTGVVNGPIVLKPVTIGAADARATSNAGSSNAVSATSTAGAPPAGLGDLTGTGSLVMAIAMAMGLM